MKIALHTNLTGVGWFRGLGPGAYMRERGHVVEVLDKGKRPPAELREIARTADVLHYVAPKGPYIEAPAEVLTREGALVVDLDDDMWAWLEEPAHKIQTGIAPPLTEQQVRDLETWLRAADLVTTTTETLAEVLRAHGARDVAVTPNAIDAAMQRTQPRAHELAPAPKSVLEKALPKRFLKTRAIGWSGSIGHITDLPPVLRAIRELATLDPSIEVRTLGPVNWLKTPTWAAPPTWQIRYSPTLAGTREGQASWTVPFPLYYDALEAMDPDVAVLPLRSTAFTRAKSDVTLLSWSVQGVPSICSRTGPYAEAEKRGFPAIFVDHDDIDGWKSALTSMLHSSGDARALGGRAHRWVLEQHSFPAAAEPWERAWERAITNRHSLTSA